ncbi:hypothetical protein ISS40_01320 [Candidatus Bathyarchaeota archaeon]|nr:hypothetical protein [Candidatus Bathyarchaeota archaeon]MBL7167289.1 hypothetical protein [Candidatus Bathyarchaeota archaeon]
MPEIDERSFNLGKQVGEIKAWCEAARSGAKDMSLSAPFRPKDYESILPHMEEQAGRNDVKFHLERSLMGTDLFGEMDLSGIWIFIIYAQEEVLERYLALKAEKEMLKAEGKYEGEAKRSIAIGLGRLLGYSEAHINRRLKMNYGS